MKRLVLLASVSAFCCIHNSAKFWSAYGSSHSGSVPTIEEVDRDESFVRTVLTSDFHFPRQKVNEALQAAEVTWVDLPWEKGGHIYRGVTEGRHIIVSHYPGAYRHELAHLIGAYVGNPDKCHTARYWAAFGFSEDSDPSCD